MKWNTWAVILAGGEGSRLKTLTSLPDGSWVPKQFCSLRDGPTLLQQAIDRARAVAPWERICVILTERHRPWWPQILSGLPPENLLVQPDGRGTANGILLPLLSILERDPDALIAIFPADHHFGDEPALAEALRTALAGVEPSAVTLLGVEPDAPDPHLGYIIPSDVRSAGPARVRRFVEKPGVDAARELLAAGALWNAFILLSPAKVLLSLYGSEFNATIRRMLFMLHEWPDAAASGFNVYRDVPCRDFSRDVLTGRESRLRVWRVPDCRWTDLGTPERVLCALQREPGPAPRSALALASMAGRNMSGQ